MKQRKMRSIVVTQSSKPKLFFFEKDKGNLTGSFVFSKGGGKKQNYVAKERHKEGGAKSIRNNLVFSKAFLNATHKYIFYRKDGDLLWNAQTVLPVS